MGLTFAPTGKTVFSSCDNELYDWSMPAGGQPGLQMQTSYSEPSSDADMGGQVLADGTRPAVLNISAEGVQVWQVNAQESGALASIHASSAIVPGSLAFSTSGRSLLADTTYSPYIRLWDLGNPAEPRNLGVYPELIPSGTGVQASAVAQGVALSGDGRLLAASEVVNGGPAVALRRTAHPTAPPVATIRDLSNGALALALSSDGHLLAVSDNADLEAAATSPPAVKLFSLRNLAHPRLLASLPGNTFKVLFSPDGRMLVALTANMVLSWDISNPGKPVELPAEHLSPASGFADGAFSPDGVTLAVQDSTGVLWLWHVTRDRILGDPDVINPGPVEGNAIAFSPDGQLLASAGLLNGSTDPARIAANLCGIVGDPITPVQWQRYVPGLPYQPPCRDGRSFVD